MQALFGGALIGLGAIMLMLTLGKIAGISGITFNALRPGSVDKSWRWAFILGLIVAPLITQSFGFGLPRGIEMDLSLMALAGLLVGIGTKMGSGCTSGHGICGIGRLSKRSILATVIFMLSAFSTVGIVKHLI